MNEELTPAGAMQIVNDAAECGDHPCDVPFSEDQIEKVFYISRDDNDGTNSYTFFRLKDGRHVAAYESSDYTGHG